MYLRVGSSHPRGAKLLVLPANVFGLRPETEQTSWWLLHLILMLTRIWTTPGSDDGAQFKDVEDGAPRRSSERIRQTSGSAADLSMNQDQTPENWLYIMNRRRRSVRLPVRERIARSVRVDDRLVAEHLWATSINDKIIDGLWKKNLPKSSS